MVNKKSKSIKKKFLKKVGTTALALSTAAGSIGCASSAQRALDRDMQILKALNTKYIEDLRRLPGGYVTKIDGHHTLKTVAGIYSGTIKVKKTPSGYSADGYYSQFEDPKSLKKAAKDADGNKDKIITNKEAENLLEETYRKYGK